VIFTATNVVRARDRQLSQQVWVKFDAVGGFLAGCFFGPLVDCLQGPMDPQSRPTHTGDDPAMEPISRASRPAISGRLPEETDNLVNTRSSLVHQNSMSSSNFHTNRVYIQRRRGWILQQRASMLGQAQVPCRSALNHGLAVSLGPSSPSAPCEQKIIFDCQLPNLRK